jgi:hypothetical protein
MAETFRNRLPPPWKIIEVWDAFEIYDSHGIRLLTIHAVERSDSYGTPGRYILDVNISSSFEIAQRWGLTNSLASSPQ